MPQQHSTKKDQFLAKRKVAQEQAEKINADLAKEVKKDQQDQIEQAGALLEVVNESARHVRNFYITFLLVALYILLIVWSTTDEMLLRISPITLPILKLQVPIKGFYAIVPPLFLLLHFNLLLQLYLLAKKLSHFNQQLDRLPTEDSQQHFQIRLFAFPFVQLISANHSSRWAKGILNLMVWLLIIILPPVVLIQLQLGFLPFHDSPILWGQRIAVALDLLLLFCFFSIIRKQGGQLWVRCVQWCLLVSISASLFVFSWGLATLPNEAKAMFWADWIPLSFWITKSNHKRENGELILTVALFDNHESPFHRNLRLSEKLLIANTIKPSEEQLLRNEKSDPDKLQAALDNIQ
jgi:hypothetical protein